ncbi:hypothetical protein [Saccharothrix sp. NRRL B-16348]|uniref:hypothetical protein n=1 Tax=Saccharothrix sp. NRRL B-16348 TaxID=1415542 RepID=UPI000A78A7E4|nr:hypothetical protein [Saccharothrix sp. NRRL B-16348]
MAQQVMHRGKRSWWNGDVTTLCGLLIPDDRAASVWFPSLSGNKRCPTCESVHRSGQRR